MIRVRNLFFITANIFQEICFFWGGGSTFNFSTQHRKCCPFLWCNVVCFLITGENAGQFFPILENRRRCSPFFWWKLRGDSIAQPLLVIKGGGEMLSILFQEDLGVFDNRSVF